MQPIVVALLAGLLLVYSLISGRLSGTVLTAPLLFVVIGFIAGPTGVGLTEVEVAVWHAAANCEGGNGQGPQRGLAVAPNRLARATVSD